MMGVSLSAQVRLHQVDAGQELVGGVDALQVLAGDVHEHGQTGAGADEHGLEAVLLHQLVNGHGACRPRCWSPRSRPWPSGPSTSFCDDGLGQTELGNAVHQHAAGQMQRLEHRDLIALLAPDRRRRSGPRGRSR